MMKNIDAKKSLRKALSILVVFWLMASNLYSQTQLYEQYKHRTDITVACIMQYPISDSVKTDVTMFIPNSKEALWTMVQEFNLGLEKDTVYNRFGVQKKYSLYTYNVRKDNIKKRYGSITCADDYKNMMILAYSYNKGGILIFHDIDTEERYDEINDFLLEALKKPKLLNKSNNKNK